MRTVHAADAVSPTDTKKEREKYTETKHQAITEPLLTKTIAVLPTAKGIRGYQVTFVSQFAA